MKWSESKRCIAFAWSKSRPDTYSTSKPAVWRRIISLHADNRTRPLVVSGPFTGSQRHQRQQWMQDPQLLLCAQGWELATGPPAGKTPIPVGGGGTCSRISQRHSSIYGRPRSAVESERRSHKCRSSCVHPGPGRLTHTVRRHGNRSGCHHVHGKAETSA